MGLETFDAHLAVVQVALVELEEGLQIAFTHKQCKRRCNNDISAPIPRSDRQRVQKTRGQLLAHLLCTGFSRHRFCISIHTRIDKSQALITAEGYYHLSPEDYFLQCEIHNTYHSTFVEFELRAGAQVRLSGIKGADVLNVRHDCAESNKD
jgi:hypothetical protein